MKRPMLFLFVMWCVSAISAEESPHLGEQLPDFTLASYNHDTISLSDYRGRVVMLFTFGHG